MSHIILNPQWPHLYVMIDPFHRSEASFGLGQQTHGELEQARELEVKTGRSKKSRTVSFISVSFFSISDETSTTKTVGSFPRKTDPLIMTRVKT